MKIMLKLRDLPPPVKPREFCRIWFGLQNLSPSEIDACETETGYRAKCIDIIARVLGLSVRAVRSWGRGLEFENMPASYEKSLGYALKNALNGSKKAA